VSSALVSIVMGSDSDLEIMREAGKALEEFGIGYEIDVTSAHRSPERTADFAKKAATVARENFSSYSFPSDSKKSGYKN